MNRLDSHTYRLYEEELAEVRSGFMEMAGLVESQLKDAVRALEDLDANLADQVIVREELIDKLEIELEQACTQIIALRAPTAGDLRSILGTMRSVRELERIGDEIKKIASVAIELEEKSFSETERNEAHRLSKYVSLVVNDTLDAFGRMDEKQALKILEQDKKIDAEYASTIEGLITHMMEDPLNIPNSIKVLWVLRSLERIGDHAQNICEAIIYIVQGKDIRHGNLEE